MNYGMLLLEIWLLLMGMIGILSLNFQYMNIIMGLLAIAAAVLLLLKK